MKKKIVPIMIVLIIIGVKIFTLLACDTNDILLDILIKNGNPFAHFEQKNKDCPYQISNGKLYFDKADGFYQYDYENKEWEILWKKEVYDYYVSDKNVYCLEFSDNGLFNVLVRKLEDMNEKRVILKDVDDVFLSAGFIYYSRFNISQNERVIYQYDTSTHSDKKILTIDIYPISSKTEKKVQFGELIFASEKYIVFLEDPNEIAWYNRDKSEWNYFKLNISEKDCYFWIKDIVASENSLYVQVTVCEEGKTGIAGPYYERGDAEENGIWEIDMGTVSWKQLNNKVYSGGIYFIGNMLYGIDNFNSEIVANETFSKTAR